MISTIDKVYDALNELIEVNNEMLAALESTKQFLEHGPEFPLHLSADAQELQEQVRVAIAATKEKG